MGQNQENAMNQYLLNVIQPSGNTQPLPGALAAIMKDVTEVRDAMKAEGAWVFSGGLHPASASTVVRVKEDDVLMTDGPFAEGREQIGGLTIVNAPDLDAALRWAVRLAKATTLPIEVRPFFADAPRHA
jgi:hypothetical protein